jgi:hypothetical protein
LKKFKVQSSKFRVQSYKDRDLDPGTKPDLWAGVTGSWPYYKIFHMVTGPKSSAISRDFVAFVSSQEGKKILTRTGNYVTKGR